MIFQIPISEQVKMPALTLIVGVIIAVAILSRLLRIGHRPKNYPPGPPTLPILGNIHQVRFQDPWHHALHTKKGRIKDALARCSSPI